MKHSRVYTIAQEIAMQRLVLFLSAVSIFGGCAVFKIGAHEEPAINLPRAEREFRAVWVATVGNIDWPSRTGLTTEEQQKEARAILDTASSLNLNAIIFQVRPHCDALYQSELEPWSYYLTGEQGKPPEPYYDPLEFWVNEAHTRGLELHVWFNPYRAHLPRGGEVTVNSIVRKRPDLAKDVGNGTYWLDPGKREVQDLSYNVVMDVLRRYDVDGVHFDDYFYPYGDGSFPDDESWEEYINSGGSMTRKDWRRANVNMFIERVYRGIKKEKRHVKFGLSPFGIWRPSNPPSITGFDQYDRLYADARLWLNKGWVDYWTPQLYWPISQIPQSFPVLLGWWSRENKQGRNLWPGMFTSRMAGSKGVEEISNQIMIARGFVPEGPGHIHFSMRTFLRDSSTLVDGLKKGPYQKPALVPSSLWLDDDAPSTPQLTTSSGGDTIVVSWSHADENEVFRWVVYYQYNTTWDYIILNKTSRSISLPFSRIVENRSRDRHGKENIQTTTVYLSQIAVSAVDRTGNESELILQNVAPRQLEALKEKIGQF